MLAPVQRSFYFCSVKIVQFFFRLSNQTVCYVSKTFVFQCIKGNTLGKYPAFLGLFVWIEKDREQDGKRILSNAAHAQLTRKL